MRPVVARSQQVLNQLCGERAASRRKRTSTSRTPFRQHNSQRAAAHRNQKSNTNSGNRNASDDHARRWLGRFYRTRGNQHRSGTRPQHRLGTGHNRLNFRQDRPGQTVPEQPLPLTFLNQNANHKYGFILFIGSFRNSLRIRHLARVRVRVI